MSGYPPQQYPPQQNGGGYPPQQNAGGYPPQQNGGGYPPQQNGGGYPPQQNGGVDPQQQNGGMYPPQQAGGGYPTKANMDADVDVPTWTGHVATDAPKTANDNAVVTSTAPSFENMPAIPGYTDIGNACRPPTYDETMTSVPDRSALPPTTSISEDEAREAFLAWVSEHCCYGKGVVKDLLFRSIEPSSAFHYQLESFTEQRVTAWTYKPYSSGPVDGPQFGVPPGPWDIMASPTVNFVDAEQKIEVPHTSSVSPCHQCHGNTLVVCPRCYGRGRTTCIRCSGSGNEATTTWETDSNGHRVPRSCIGTCSQCCGSGMQRCHLCRGHGCVPCPTCEAHGKLRNFLELTVTWKNNVSDDVVERTDLPDDLIKNADGDTVFEEEAIPFVMPVNHFNDQAINNGSAKYCNDHRQRFANMRMLRQRHNVRLVPVAEVSYEYKDDLHRYWVFGNEQQVHHDGDYPANCCCGCNIL